MEEDWSKTKWRSDKLQLRLVDGGVLENTCQTVMGDADMPWSEAALKQKFIINCEGSLSPARSLSLADHVLHAPAQAAIFP